ncbi:MAG: hypothetical protein JWO44_1789 [Bacteroidetes bacterium]|nr:hypothetical protein [Bacteroidota bacterium]
MAEETQYTGNTGMVTISTANAELDGTGTMGSVITGASNGTLVKTLTIKAQGDITAIGMVRLFIYDGTNTRAIGEIEIPATTKSSRDATFEKTIGLDLNLKSGYVLKASTNLGQTYNVIAFGLDWAYYGSSVRTDTTQYTAATGIGTISTANSNLDGTGTLGTVLTAGTSGGGFKGCKVEAVTIKALVSTSPGMVRLFIQDTSSNKKLFKEVPVPYVNKSASAESFCCVINFENLNLAPGYSLLASTQVAESFVVTAEAMNWNYVA